MDYKTIEKELTKKLVAEIKLTIEKASDMAIKNFDKKIAELTKLFKKLTIAENHINDLIAKSEVQTKKLSDAIKTSINDIVKKAANNISQKNKIELNQFYDNVSQKLQLKIEPVFATLNEIKAVTIDNHKFIKKYSK